MLEGGNVDSSSHSALQRVSLHFFFYPCLLGKCKVPAKCISKTGSVTLFFEQLNRHPKHCPALFEHQSLLPPLKHTPKCVTIKVMIKPTPKITEWWFSGESFIYMEK